MLRGKYQKAPGAGYPALDGNTQNRCSGRSLPSQSHLAIPPLTQVIAQLELERFNFNGLAHLK